MIPKIIHHIAPMNKDMWHPLWEKCRNSFVNNFFDYDFMLWNDCDDINRLVYDNYNEFWNLYNSFPHQIMKIDFSRLCMIHKYGGIYADMDYYCYKNFDEFLTNDVVLIESTSDTYTSDEFENCLMAGTKNNDFFYDAIFNCRSAYLYFKVNEYFNNKGEGWRNNIGINNTAGSGYLSSAIKKYGYRYDIGKFPAELFNQDPPFYNEHLIGRHFHSQLWGDHYLDMEMRECFVVKDHKMYSAAQKFLDIIPNCWKWEDIDFYRNYNDT